MIPLTGFPIFGKMNLLKLQNKGIYQRKYFNPFAVPSCCNRVGEGLRKQVHCRLHKGKILKGGKARMYYFKKIFLSNSLKCLSLIILSRYFDISSTVKGSKAIALFFSIGTKHWSRHVIRILLLEFTLQK